MKYTGWPMKIRETQKYLQRPGLYEPGTKNMWTDPHISAALLEMHLDPRLDSASRKPEHIDRTLEFLSGFISRSGMHVLDLGCGPGLYAERLDQAGCRVTGVDFSERSIRYARESAQVKGLDITYHCMDYLELNEKESFDLVLLIYTDFGVLLPGDRSLLLRKVHRALKKTGLFIFDVLNDRHAPERFVDEKDWSLEEKGFWKAEPYLELVNYYHYPADQVYLKQHAIWDEKEKLEIYRFWMHYFSSGQMCSLLSEHGFGACRNFEHILPDTNMWDGEHLSFYSAQAIK